MENYSLTKTSAPELADAKQQYLNQLPSPLDGMWECFVDMADHYSINGANQSIGYCAVNSNQQLVQFSVTDLSVAVQVFRFVVDDLKIVGAFVATCETPYLSLCMDQQKSVSVNAFMYHLGQHANLKNAAFPEGSEFRLTKSNELGLAVEFGIRALDADPDWLSRYFAERIERGELFALWQRGSLIATGECRLSRTQQPYADLGVLVSKSYRGKGVATSILQQLLIQCQARQLKPICSTERENIAAQKAISKSGFVSQHRVLKLKF